MTPAERGLALCRRMHLGVKTIIRVNLGLGHKLHEYYVVFEDEPGTDDDGEWRSGIGTRHETAVAQAIAGVLADYTSSTDVDEIAEALIPFLTGNGSDEALAFLCGHTLSKVRAAGLLLMAEYQPNPTVAAPVARKRTR